MIDRDSSKSGAAQLKSFVLSGIAEGRLHPGARLPTERELIAAFKTARSAARRVLAELEADGHIVRGVGRGTFVAGGSQAGTSAAAAEIRASPAELMDARLAFEPRVAEMVVTHATEDDFERMAHCLERAERGPTLNDFELWDAALHQTIAKATHNRLVIAVFETFSRVRGESEWGKLKDRIVTPERRVIYQQQHRRIVEALRRRDGEAARAAMIEHLLFARDNLFG